VKYSNPRLIAEFNDWPIGGSNRGQCRFAVEDGGKKGYRVSRTTTNKFGSWCNPKYTTYGGAACIVDGEDGRTYILQQVTEWGAVKVWQHDFKTSEYFSHSTDDVQYRELLAVIGSTCEAFANLCKPAQS
jgi:hypothetical protein